MTLPATFRGDLPCADCEAIRHQVDLAPDHTFNLRREWLAREVVVNETGRWRIDPERHVLLLDGVGESALQFQILDDDRLRLLDVEGRPIESRLPYELIREPVGH